MKFHSKPAAIAPCPYCGRDIWFYAVSHTDEQRSSLTEAVVTVSVKYDHTCPSRESIPERSAA